VVGGDVHDDGVPDYDEVDHDFEPFLPELGSQTSFRNRSQIPMVIT